MSERLIFNGIHDASGDYLLLPLTPRQVLEIAQREPQDDEHIQELKVWYERITRALLGPKEESHPRIWPKRVGMSC